MADDIFDADELAADAVTENQEAPGTAEQPQQDAQPRDETGKFAPKQDPLEGVLNADGGDVADEGKPQGTVPQGALHAEREKRKGLEKELNAAREQLAAIAQMREQIQSRQPDPLPAADPSADPSGTEHLRQRVEQLAHQQNQFTQQADLQRVEQAEMEQLGQVLVSSETEFRAVKPDYDNAIDHVINARASELALYGLTPPEIQEAIKGEITDIARSAIQQGKNPAELGYQIALSRGYRPNGAAGQGGAAATLDAIAAARGASKSLGASAGSTPQTLNAQAIAAMDSDEFERLYSTPEGRRMIDAL